MRNAIRLIFVAEFLLALCAVFIAWPEVAGQEHIDLMHWGWRLGFGLAVPAAVVYYTACLIEGESARSFRAIRALTLIVLLLVGMGLVTYYYHLQEEPGDTEEQDNVSAIRNYSCIIIR